MLGTFSVCTPGWRSDLVSQYHGIDTVSALHATENLSVVSAGVNQVVTPISYERTCATSAGSRVELIPGSKKFKSMSFPTVVHSSNTRRLFCRHVPFHESAPGS